MKTKSYEIGMVGLGVMGRNLLLNMADHGHSVAGYDQDAGKIKALHKEAEGRDIRGATSLKEFVALLRVPRAVMMLVPAGPPVDAVIRDLLPCLERGDLIIDGGNSHFSDLELRTKTLARRGIQFLGVGISGGEYGARHGPMRFNYEGSFAAPSPDAYETLLWDVMIHDPTLFMRADQVEAAWHVLTPVLKAWAEATPRNFPNYAAGTWGPAAADLLLTRDGHNWPLPIAWADQEEKKAGPASRLPA